MQNDPLLAPAGFLEQGFFPSFPCPLSGFIPQLLFPILGSFPLSRSSQQFHTLFSPILIISPGMDLCISIPFSFLQQFPPVQT